MPNKANQKRGQDMKLPRKPKQPDKKVSYTKEEIANAVRELEVLGLIYTKQMPDGTTRHFAVPELIGKKSN